MNPQSPAPTRAPGIPSPAPAAEGVNRRVPPPAAFWREWGWPIYFVVADMAGCAPALRRNSRPPDGSCFAHGAFYEAVILVAAAGWPLDLSYEAWRHVRGPKEVP